MGRSNRNPQEDTMIQEKLNSDCRMHLYKAEDGRLRSNHLLRDCREFNKLADKFVALRKAAVAATPLSTPQPSSAPAIMAPPTYTTFSRQQHGRSNPSSSTSRRTTVSCTTWLDVHDPAR